MNKEHPEGMINLLNVKESRIAPDDIKIRFGYNLLDHVLIINMGRK